MPPRRRPRRGNTRMDAAQDAMRAYGFDSKLVCKTVRELLKVYTEEGWSFIEEYSYKLLLDTILEKVEEQEAEDKGGCSQGNGSTSDNNTPDVEAQNEVVLADSNMQVAGTALPCSKALVTPEFEDTAPLSDESDDRVCLRPALEEEGRVSGDINSEHIVKKKRIDTSSMENKDADSGVRETASNAPIHSPPSPLSSLLPMECDSPRRHREHCHGWIDSDEELDIVELTPTPLPEKLRKVLDRMDGLHRPDKNGRKSGILDEM